MTAIDPIDLVTIILMLITAAFALKWFILFFGAQAGDIAKHILDEIVSVITRRQWNAEKLNALGMLLIIALAFTTGRMIEKAMVPTAEEATTLALAAMLIWVFTLSIIGFVSCVLVIGFLRRR